MKTIANKNFQEERELYNQRDIEVLNCRFEGPKDGESAIKECSNVLMQDCYMALRYSLWHDNQLIIEHSEITDKCRAPLWYCNYVELTDTTMHGPKAFRECSDIKINNCDMDSLEFCWRCQNVEVNNSTLKSQYPFFMVDDLKLNKLDMEAKYSLQYCNNVYAKDCKLVTRDAFWHSKNVTVENTLLEGEYLAWYSENLTLINCTIKGTQPLCYCKGLKLINCKMIDCDLSFEYSEVDATIIGEVDSIKNPLRGKIVCENAKEIILQDSKYRCDCEIICTKKGEN